MQLKVVTLTCLVPFSTPKIKNKQKGKSCLDPKLMVQFKAIMQSVGKILFTYYCCSLHYRLGDHKSYETNRKKALAYTKHLKNSCYIISICELSVTIKSIASTSMTII